MSAFKVDLSALNKLAAKFADPALKAELERVPQKKAIAALIGQGIAENFQQEGPGWAPLKPATIRGSLAKKMRKAVAGMGNKELARYDKKLRAAGDNPLRRILYKSGLLYKTATTPNFHGSNKNMSGGNIYKVEGTNIIWGTDLVYAGAHNKGNPKKGIPKREFLTLKDKWKQAIMQFAADEYLEILRRKLGLK